jgi:glutamate-1-semialdehyde 2,1-aminomutase
MSCLFFTPECVTSWKTAAGCNTKAYAVYFHAMLDRGVYLAPAQFEAAFVSAAHTDADIEATLVAQREALQAAKAVL